MNARLKLSRSARASVRTPRLKEDPEAAGDEEQQEHEEKEEDEEEHEEEHENEDEDEEEEEEEDDEDDEEDEGEEEGEEEEEDEEEEEEETEEPTLPSQRKRRRKPDPSKAATARLCQKPQKTQQRQPTGKRPEVVRGARVPRARLLELAARYKDIHDRFKTDGTGVPEGDFEIEQLLCSDADGALLVKWAGYDVPSWEPESAIPTDARNAYLREGRVALREYLALLEAAC